MNIEKTISEHAVSDILTPMLESQDRIVTEDVAPLFNKATGLDTPPASGSVTTTIEESRSVITAIIRKAWTATLTMLGGASVIGYITAAYTYLRSRLQGNETYGIPDRRSEISASSPLAANLALLNDRKIGGVPEAADGMSLVQLITSAYADITELTDDTEWTNMARNYIFTIFPNVEKLTLNCENLSVSLINGQSVKELHMPRLKMFGESNGLTLVWGDSEIEELEFPELTNIRTGQASVVGNMAKLKKASFPKLAYFDAWAGFYAAHFLDGNCPLLEEIYMPSFESITNFEGSSFITNLPELKYVHLGHPTLSYRNFGNGILYNCPKLIKVEFANGMNKSINLSGWSPTLDSSNLQQFLSNFRDYIANRLTDNGSGKILTLSQAVFSAIWDANGDPQVYQDSPEMTQCCADIDSIMTTKQWEVNKAS